MEADCIPLVQEFQKELSQWRKDPSGSKKKPKYSYKTVEELKAKGRVSKKLAAPQKELSQVKVRGPCTPGLGRWKTSARPSASWACSRALLSGCCFSPTLLCPGVTGIPVIKTPVGILFLRRGRDLPDLPLLPDLRLSFRGRLVCVALFEAEATFLEVTKLKNAQVPRPPMLGSWHQH